MRAIWMLFVIVGWVFLLQGCSDGSDSHNEAATQFSYSVLTSDSGRGLDLVEELNNSVLPRLKKEGGQKYAIWSRAADSINDFEEIAEDKLVVMLRWKQVKTTRLSEALEAMAGVTEVTTSLWEVSLRVEEGPIETGDGFYIHRFNRNQSEDTDQILSLSEQAWATWEPFWEAKAVGVWRDLDEVDESNGITRTMRIAWYRDMEHWQETRQVWLEPDSVEFFIERIALQLDNEGWSANLQSH